MKTSKIGTYINEFCSPYLAEDWDNCGFQILLGDNDVRKVMVALEITGDVVEEAVKSDVQMIVTHHPLLFSNVKIINSNDIIGNHIIKLINNGISVFSCHTNFDKMEGGNNDYFGKIAGFSDIKKLLNDSSGFCRKGILPSPVTPEELVSHLAGCLGIDRKHIRIAGDNNKQIKTCAWCTGAGSDFINNAFEEGCDCYITGDLKYHEVQDAGMLGRCIIDAGHFGTEKIFVPNMAELLCKSIVGKEVQIIQSAEDINPFK